MTQAKDLPAPTPKSPVYVPVEEIDEYLRLHGLQIVEVRPTFGGSPEMVVRKMDERGER